MGSWWLLRKFLLRNFADSTLYNLPVRREKTRDGQGVFCVRIKSPWIHGFRIKVLKPSFSQLSAKSRCSWTIFKIMRKFFASESIFSWNKYENMTMIQALKSTNQKLRFIIQLIKDSLAQYILWNTIISLLPSSVQKVFNDFSWVDQFGTVACNEFT